MVKKVEIQLLTFFPELYFGFNLFEYILQITVTTSVYHRYFELFDSDKH